MYVYGNVSAIAYSSLLNEIVDIKAQTPHNDPDLKCKNVFTRQSKD